MKSYSDKLKEKIGQDVLEPTILELQAILGDSERYLDPKSRVSIATVIVRLKEFSESLQKEKKKVDPRYNYLRNHGGV